MFYSIMQSQEHKCVHCNDALKYLQLPLQVFLQSHLIISWQLAAASGSLVHTGSNR